MQKQIKIFIISHKTVFLKLLHLFFHLAHLNIVYVFNFKKLESGAEIQWFKPLLAALTFHIATLVLILTALLLIQHPANVPRESAKMAQVLGPLATTWEICMMFLVPGLGLAHSQPQKPLRNKPEDRIALFSLSHPAFQIQINYKKI